MTFPWFRPILCFRPTAAWRASKSVTALPCAFVECRRTAQLYNAEALLAQATWILDVAVLLNNSASSSSTMANSGSVRSLAASTLAIQSALLAKISKTSSSGGLLWDIEGQIESNRRAREAERALTLRSHLGGKAGNLLMMLPADNSTSISIYHHHVKLSKNHAANPSKPHKSTPKRPPTPFQSITSSVLTQCSFENIPTGHSRTHVFFGGFLLLQRLPALSRCQLVLRLTGRAKKDAHSRP